MVIFLLLTRFETSIHNILLGVYEMLLGLGLEDVLLLLVIYFSIIFLSSIAIISWWIPWVYYRTCVL